MAFINNHETYEEALVGALDSIAYQLRELGKGDASDPKGAMEFLGIKIHEGCQSIADAMEYLREIAEALNYLAQVISERGK